MTRNLNIAGGLIAVGHGGVTPRASDASIHSGLIAEAKSGSCN